jgi:hypothetical protein
VLVLVLAGCLFASTPAAAGFIEVGDAGDLPGTALLTEGPGLLDALLGNLSSADPFEDALDIDMYGLYIADPAGFSASTVDSPGFNVSDPQLFLFTAGGIGVFMNDDDPSGLNGAQSALGALPLGFVPGLYYLAIGWFDNEPVSALGALIFDAIVSADPVADWDDNVLQVPDLPTAYQINLTGAAAAVPEPAALSLAVLGLAGALMRRMRGGARRGYVAWRET